MSAFESDRIKEIAHTLSVDSDSRNKQEILDLLRSDDQAVFLDIGCNDGTFTVEIAAAMGVSQVYGLEIDEHAAKAAKAKSVKVACADLNRGLPFIDDYFDVILANQVIEHLYFTDLFIQEIRRILKPTGTLIISTTNLAALHYRIWLLLGWQPSCLHPCLHQFGNHLRGKENPLYGHKSVFTYQAFREFLEFSGFMIESCKSSGVHFLSGRPGEFFLHLFPALGIFTTVKARIKS